MPLHKIGSLALRMKLPCFVEKLNSLLISLERKEVCIRVVNISVAGSAIEAQQIPMLTKKTKSALSRRRFRVSRNVSGTRFSPFSRIINRSIVSGRRRRLLNCPRFRPNLMPPRNLISSLRHRSRN